MMEEAVCCEVSVSLFNPVEFKDTFIVETSDRYEAMKYVLGSYSQETLSYLTDVKTKLIIE
tara:strand:- start:83 stop:265 length:183 start_codon:yes stop_codon:yes gene_type:complete